MANTELRQAKVEFSAALMSRNTDKAGAALLALFQTVEQLNREVEQLRAKSSGNPVDCTSPCQQTTNDCTRAAEEKGYENTLGLLLAGPLRYVQFIGPARTDARIAQKQIEDRADRAR